MKTILLVSIIALTLGGIYLTTTQNNNQIEISEDINSLTAFEDDVQFQGNKCFWDLSTQSMDDSLLNSLQKTIGRRLQGFTSDPIYELTLNLRNNRIYVISGLLQAIDKGIPTLRVINLDLSDNFISDIDEMFASSNTLLKNLKKFNVNLSNNRLTSIAGMEKWDVLPLNLNEFTFNLSTNLRTNQDIKDYKPLINVIESIQYLEILDINLFENTGDSELLATSIAQNQKNLETIRLDLGNNFFAYEWTKQIKYIVQNNSLLTYVEFGLYYSNLQLYDLNAIEEALYDHPNITYVQLDVRSNGQISLTNTDQIFADLRDKIGDTQVIMLL